MLSQKLWITKSIAIYLMVGGVICFILFIFNLGISVFLNSLIPALITSLVLSFFIISGLLFLLNNTFKWRWNLLQISLIMQTVQIVLIGFSFKNYFGPYAGIGFTDTPFFNAILELKGFTFLFANGYNQESNEISVVVNLFPLILLLIFGHIYRKELDTLR